MRSIENADFDEFKHLCDETTIKLVRLRPSNDSNRRNFSNNNNRSLKSSFPSALEMNAMSVVSLYDQDYTKEMDCDE